MTQKLSKIPNFDAVLYKNENNTWFSCFAVYVLASNTRVVPYFNSRVWPPGDHTRLNYYSPVHTRQNR